MFATLKSIALGAALALTTPALAIAQDYPKNRSA